MRARLAIPAVAIAIFVALGASVVLMRVVPLQRAADGIAHPVHVTALSTRLGSGGGKNTVVHATVEYDTPDGRTRTVLPQLGNGVNDYLDPVRLVYDADHPDRAMLATDWRYARTTGPALKLWFSVAALVVAGLVLLVVAALVLLRRYGTRRRRPGERPLPTARRWTSERRASR